MKMPEALKWAADFAKEHDLFDYKPGHEFSPGAKLKIIQDLANEVWTPEGYIEVSEVLESFDTVMNQRYAINIPDEVKLSIRAELRRSTLVRADSAHNIKLLADQGAPGVGPLTKAAGTGRR